MAINIPGMNKIDEILKKVSAKVEASQSEDNLNSPHQPIGLIGLLRASVSLKFMLGSAFLLLISLLFLLSATFKIVRVASDYNHVEMTTPTLEDYIPTLKTSVASPSLDSNEDVISEKESAEKLEFKKDFELEKGFAIDKAFDFLAKFENNRAYKTLISIKPVISGVKKSSPADDAELQTGDMILKVNGAPIESVLGYYLATTDKPTTEITLEVERKSKTLTLKLISNTNKSLNSSNIGISFEMPRGMAYVTQEDAKNLSRQYQESFLGTIPQDKQKIFANNLMRMAQKISYEGQVLMSTNSPQNYPISRLKTPDFLQWQHQKFSESIDQYYENRNEKQTEVIACLSKLGDSLTGVAAAMIAFILAVMYYVFFSRK